MFNTSQDEILLSGLVDEIFKQAHANAMLKLTASPNPVSRKDIDNLNNKLLDVLREFDINKKYGGGVYSG